MKKHLQLYIGITLTLIVFLACNFPTISQMPPNDYTLTPINTKTPLSCPVFFPTSPLIGITATSALQGQLETLTNTPIPGTLTNTIAPMIFTSTVKPIVFTLTASPTLTGNFNSHQHCYPNSHANTYSYPDLYTNPDTNSHYYTHKNPDTYSHFYTH